MHALELFRKLQKTFGFKARASYPASRNTENQVDESQAPSSPSVPPELLALRQNVLGSRANYKTRSERAKESDRKVPNHQAYQTPKMKKNEKSQTRPKSEVKLSAVAGTQTRLSSASQTFNDQEYFAAVEIRQNLDREGI